MVCLALHRAKAAHLPEELSMLPISNGLLQMGRAHLPTYPASRLPVLFGPMRIRDLVVHIVPIHQILQDGTAFPDLEPLTDLVGVDEGWDSTVGVDVEVPLLLLLVFKKFDWAYLYAKLCQSFLFFFVSKRGLAAVMGSCVVLQAQFLEGDGDLERIGGALAIERNLVLLSVHCGRK